jgi:hypothetical protein
VFAELSGCIVTKTQPDCSSARPLTARINEFLIASEYGLSRTFKPLQVLWKRSRIHFLPPLAMLR